MHPGPSATPAAGPLHHPRKRVSYNPAEQAYSSVLARQVDDLLTGKRGHLELLRQYHDDRERLGIMATPDGFPREGLRLAVVERMLRATLRLIGSSEDGGPIEQYHDTDGATIERQLFPTKYPHIVIERTDRYVPGAEDPSETTWALDRVQNQRAQLEVNRLLDIAGLAVEALHFVIPSV